MVLALPPWEAFRKCEGGQALLIVTAMGLRVLLVFGGCEAGMEETSCDAQTILHPGVLSMPSTTAPPVFSLSPQWQPLFGASYVPGTLDPEA